MPPLQTPGVCGPLTAALGLPIVTLTTPFAEGTGGLYLYKSQDCYVFLTYYCAHNGLPLGPSLLLRHPLPSRTDYDSYTSDS
jgi:hypothetical protein